jgi:EmrB/QacA subfamily drug resistance transporter
MSAAAAPRAAHLAGVPVEEQAPARHSLLLAVCCLAQFMVILDVSIVNVALPSIHRSLDFDQSQLQWVVNAYTITFAGFLMLSGRAADLFGQRRTFMVGLGLFALASLLGGEAVNRQMLVGARGLQGLGGAVMAASSLAIITSSFAAGPERFRAIGLWGAMNGAGGAAGTLLGGIITQELSWRWVLLINLPIGIAGVLVARVVVHERRRQGAAAGFDVAGALCVTGGLLSLVYGIVNAGSPGDGWGSPAALGPIALGVVLLLAFVVVEGRFATAPLVPLRIFNNRLLRVSNISVVLFSAALFPMWYFASLYLQEVLHFEPLDAGLAFLPMALTIMACATRAGGLMGRFGAGPVLGAGLALMATGLALFAALIQVNGSYVANFMAPSMLVAIGVGLSVVPSTIAATATAAPSEAGLASGLVNTSRQMGGALGLALLASLAVLYTGHLTEVDYRAPILAFTDGFRLAFLLGAGLAGTGALIAFAFIPKTVRPPGHGASPVPAPAAGAPQPATVAQVPPAPQAAPGPQAAPVPPVAPAPQVAPMPQAAPPAPPAALEPPATPAPHKAPQPPAAPPPERTAPNRHTQPVARVVFSVAGGGSWALAGGSMTVRTEGQARPRA